MPRIVRRAEVAWEGSLARGSGTATAVTTGAFTLPIDEPSRVADGPERTSPEELLAAAHAGCYSMSLAGEIARAGGRVEALRVLCTVTMDEVPGKGHQIVASEIDASARATGIDQGSLEEAAATADEGCPFSALIRASASVSVTATLES